MFAYGIGPLSIDAGPSARNLPVRVWNFSLFALTTSLIALAQLTLGIQFIYRYLSLCRGRTLSPREQLFALLTAVLLSVNVVPLELASNVAMSDESSRQYAYFNGRREDRLGYFALQTVIIGVGLQTSALRCPFRACPQQ